jgi:hypothetical protein
MGAITENSGIDSQEELLPTIIREEKFFKGEKEKKKGSIKVEAEFENRSLYLYFFCFHLSHLGRQPLSLLLHHFFFFL